ncbi:lipoyl(octanoyl) transferase LipB [Candidatus Thioglobus sp.]|jgi:lipoyl(octanoyl) transferase|uniref:lipoyl(octanoyl) transferase LipB n=1 Tax=Candidatus Thioglobus sp. TaxID=2026721 RepID=UPI001D6615CF|nr:lipoyl(octanoyl) transferase LipB [Candidatus Thioglobus sp.]MBT3276560.1 lipoyl(octanoyl) transferase LipB [Candidatus Thioglobus sp.]MBT3447338.1 lipoyl(octanoyl) transferase LipB [Candidatus Thioglobus sp.]MBT3744878.1 lipoyl(octanoyl) transferase LipB [Candidatus Thioglobus sp.]MBT4000799.1 lipoyl(octanoyl) transferase LipB [Candidatus Thioglobus sp.]MBT4182117.1 lipoyl(octanoyl) transferase LipB [Candidatus Thioglobus sp.]
MKVVELGRQAYAPTWQAMKDFTNTRTAKTEDELWVVEHPSIFTQGIAGKPEHELSIGAIPIVKTDRGGQITYHGPGQLVVYCLIDLKRLDIGVKKMVSIVEESVIELLSQYQITAHLETGAPGVYVDHAKIAALGLKVKQGKTYHGLSLNIDMDLTPFAQINPCGYQGLKVTQVKDLADNKINFSNIAKQLTQLLSHNITRAQ